MTDEFLSEQVFTRIKKKLYHIRYKLSNHDDDEFVVVFSGLFASGKSSIINGLLKGVFQLPTGVASATKVIVRLKYGNKFSSYYETGECRVRVKSSEITNVIIGEIALPENVTELVIEIPSPLLKDGIVILDTPGFCYNAKLDAIALSAEAVADIVVFCCSATAVWKKFEQMHLEELDCKVSDYFIVVNWMDTILSDDEIKNIKIYMEENVNDAYYRKNGYHRKYRNIYYTSAVPDNLDIGDFTECIEDLCSVEKSSYRDNLKEISRIKHIRHELSCIQEKVSDYIAFGNIFCAELQTKELERKEIKDKENRIISNSLKQYREECMQKFNGTMMSVDSGFDLLEVEDRPLEFSSLANNQIRQSFQLLVDFYSQRITDKNLRIDKKCDASLKRMRQVIHDYEVPQPEGVWVKKRGIAKQVWRSLLNASEGVSELDHGYDLEYHGYADTAKLHYRRNLLPAIMHEFDGYMSRVISLSQSEAQKSDFETDVEYAMSMYRKWRKLQEEIKNVGMLLEDGDQ